MLLAAETNAAAVLKPRVSGCGIVRDFKGDTHTGKTIESGGLQRAYDVYLPPNYDEVRFPSEPKLGKLWSRILTVDIRTNQTH